jgi:hypothetical protein
MNNVSKSDVRNILKNILFENQIKEMFTPDNFTNSRSAMFDQPGSQINGDGEELNFNVNIPVVPDDVVSVSTLKRNHNVRDKEYVPKSVELKSAFYSIFDDYDNEEISDEVAEKVWLSVTKILSKV